MQVIKIKLPAEELKFHPGRQLKERMILNRLNMVFLVKKRARRLDAV